MGLSLNHNIDKVVKDIEGVKKDLKIKPRTRLRMAMRSLLQTTIANVTADAKWRGNLIASLQKHGVKEESKSGNIEISIGTDPEIAPYAAFVEFGTGQRTGKEITGGTTARPDNYPTGFPYDSPDFMTEDLINGIIQWVKTKPIVPKEGDPNPEELGIKIAHTIVEKGTYAHPFLRPSWYAHKGPIKKAVENGIKAATR